MADHPKTKAHCNKCSGDTNHEVLFQEARKWSEDVDIDIDYKQTIEGEDSYLLVRCAGCDEVRFIHRHWFSEDYDENGAPEQYEDYYPPRILRKKPDWTLLGLPIRLGLYEFGELFDEIYRALAIKAVRLSVMGMRALVEKMMIDRVGDQGNFEKNINKFFGDGYVAVKSQDHFRNILIEAGHAAMHRDWEPNLDDANTLLDIIEVLVKEIYVNPANAAKVGNRIPPRNAVKKGG